MRTVFGLLLVLLLGVGGARAADIHVIVVGDTNDISIGGGIEANVKRVKDFFEVVKNARVADRVNIVELTGNDFSCDKINAAVAALNVKEGKDAVFFYYAGHGFRRSTTQSKFPEFYCYPSNSRSGAQLSQIVGDIVSKKPLLAIGISDSCNKDDTLPPTAAPEPGIRFPENVRRAIRHLFFEHQGTITVSGSIPGQYSWYRTEGPDAGGFFTQQFMRTLAAALASGPKPTWNAILRDATKEIRIPTNQEPPIIQQPQFEDGSTVVGPS